MSLPVQTTPEADAQIREVDGWWRANRPASANLFAEELAASFDTVGQTPNICRVYRHPTIPGMRRVLLRGTRYHVYYVQSGDMVSVLAVWHARRGVGPPLRAS